MEESFTPISVDEKMKYLEEVYGNASAYPILYVNEIEQFAERSMLNFDIVNDFINRDNFTLNRSAVFSYQSPPIKPLPPKFEELKSKNEKIKKFKIPELKREIESVKQKIEKRKTMVENSV